LVLITTDIGIFLDFGSDVRVATRPEVLASGRRPVTHVSDLTHYRRGRGQTLCQLRNNLRDGTFFTRETPAEYFHGTRRGRKNSIARTFFYFPWGKGREACAGLDLDRWERACPRPIGPGRDFEKSDLVDQAMVGSPRAGADKARASAVAKAIARQELAGLRSKFDDMPEYNFVT
jgi:hypothetical protein